MGSKNILEADLIGSGFGECGLSEKQKLPLGFPKWAGVWREPSF